MSIFIRQEWDLPYGSLMQKNQLPGTKKVIANATGEDDLTPQQPLTTKEDPNFTLNRAGGALAPLAANAGEWGNTTGKITGQKDKIMGGSRNSSRTKKRDESNSSDVNVQEGLDVAVLQKKGFYQDDEKKLQGLRKNSAARQATNAVITMLTGSNAGVLPDQAAAYLQERNALVDKYNTQLGLNGLTSYDTGRSAALGETSSLSTDDSTSSGSSFSKADGGEGSLKGVRVGVGVAADPKMPGVTWTPNADGKGGTLQIDDEKAALNSVNSGKYGVGGDAVKKAILDAQS